MDVDAARRAAGEAAVPLVEDGMRVGLGTGTTARWFILGLAERVRQGLTIRAVATSVASATLASERGIVVEELGPDGLDIAVDGADSVDPALRLIKGRGGRDAAREDRRGLSGAVRGYCRRQQIHVRACVAGFRSR